MLAEHRHTLLTLGVGVLFIAAARACRIALIPLFAESIGLSAAQTSLVFGIAGAVDMLLFYPAGGVMDRFGRMWVALPSMVILGARDGPAAARPLVRVADRGGRRPRDRATASAPASS